MVCLRWLLGEGGGRPSAAAYARRSRVRRATIGAHVREAAMLHRSEAVSGRRTLTFRLPPDHTGVSVVGTFNGWVPGLLTLQPGPDGWLEAHA